MAIKKKRNKFVVPQEYNQSAIFARGGNLYGDGDYLSIPKTGVNVTGGPDLSKITTSGVSKLNSITGATTTTPGFNAAGAIGAIPGVMGLMDSTMKDFDTSGVGKEVVGTNDMTRNDILNTNVNVDAQQKGFGAIAGDAASAAMTGMQVAGPWGALAGLIPIATGIIGNDQKQHKAEQAEHQWTNNLQAKNRQFQGQDLRTSMANFNNNGGDLFAYGGQMPQQLTEFNSGGTHESNEQGGILQGTGANGQPNLVEEGETKHEDYIFSDRLKINPQISKDFKLPKGLNGKTFAQASKYLNREAKDRPNDPISNNGVKAHLAKLTAAQEGLKEQMQPQQQQGIPMEGQPNANILAQGYANGGFIDQTHYQNPTLQGANIGAMGGNLYDGESENSNQLTVQSGVFNRNSGLNYDNTSNFWGVKDDQYTNEFQREVSNLTSNNDWFKNVVIPDLKNLGVNYVKDVGSFKKYANDKLVGPVHKYVQQGINPSPLKTPMVGVTVSPFKTPQININKPEFPANTKGSGLMGEKTGDSIDFSRYAPVAANIAMGISDMFEKPEVVKYGRVNPERITARMDYQPIDTEWMNNKMNATYAGTRDQMINQAGGNRAIAMAGLSGINQQQQNAIGEAYVKAQDINYGRRNQATKFNAGIEAQNVAAQNASQQANLQLQMQEMDANARNRAAKRNAARQAILNAASNIGDIGRENWAAKTGEAMYGYKTDGQGNIIYKK